jgi:hypothetical protein
MVRRGIVVPEYEEIESSRETWNSGESGIVPIEKTQPAFN